MENDHRSGPNRVWLQSESPAKRSQRRPPILSRLPFLKLKHRLDRLPVSQRANRDAWRKRKSLPDHEEGKAAIVPDTSLDNIARDGGRSVVGGGCCTMCGWRSAVGRRRRTVSVLLGPAAFYILARFQVFNSDAGFLIFHVGFMVWIFWFCALVWLPNNNLAPPLTVFRGMRSSKRMQADLPLFLLAAKCLPVALGFWGTQRE